MSRHQSPPPLPSEILSKVIRTAGIDGRLLLWTSGAFALVSAAGHFSLGAIAGLAAAGTGALEIHGATLLSRTDSKGLDWAIRAQLLLLVTILFYCAARLMTFDPEFVRTHMTPDLQTYITQSGLSTEQFIDLLRQFWLIGYIVVAIVSVFYQGGMALYYARRRGAISQALEETGQTPAV